MLFRSAEWSTVQLVAADAEEPIKMDAAATAATPTYLEYL